MEWRLTLDSWIIQDGNYGEFHVGTEDEFAVEFHFPEPPELVEPAPPSIQLVGADATYDLCGTVSAVVDRAWVLDCGISVFRDSLPPSGITVGDTIRGRASLGIDPFMYFERLYALPGMPPLLYAWRVNEILRHDRSRSVLTPVEHTDAWHDDDGHAGYILVCDRFDIPPKVKIGPSQLKTQLRTARPDEATHIANVFLRARHAAVPDIPPLVHDDDDVHAYFETVVMPNREVWIAELQGETIALLVLDNDWIEHLYVDPQWTGKGVGSELVTIAKVRSRDGVNLWTFQSNVNARRFYERHGFTVVAMTDGDNEEGAPDVHYRWRRL
jgi:GNAT superfamily N-acetyltransferase